MRLLFLGDEAFGRSIEAPPFGGVQQSSPVVDEWQWVLVRRDRELLAATGPVPKRPINACQPGATPVGARSRCCLYWPASITDEELVFLHDVQAYQRATLPVQPAPGRERPLGPPLIGVGRLA